MGLTFVLLIPFAIYAWATTLDGLFAAMFFSVGSAWMINRV